MMAREYQASLPMASLGVPSFSAVLGDAWLPHLVVQVAPSSAGTVVQVGSMLECRAESSNSEEVRVRRVLVNHDAWQTLDECMSDSGFWELESVYTSQDDLDCFDGLVRRFSGVRKESQHQVIRICEGTDETKATTLCFADLLESVGVSGFAEGNMSAELKEQLLAE